MEVQKLVPGPPAGMPGPRKHNPFVAVPLSQQSAKARALHEQQLRYIAPDRVLCFQPSFVLGWAPHALWIAARDVKPRPALIASLAFLGLCLVLQIVTWAQSVHRGVGRKEQVYVLTLAMLAFFAAGTGLETRGPEEAQAFWRRYSLVLMHLWEAAVILVALACRLPVMLQYLTNTSEKDKPLWDAQLAGCEYMSVAWAASTTVTGLLCLIPALTGNTSGHNTINLAFNYGVPVGALVLMVVITWLWDPEPPRPPMPPLGDYTATSQQQPHLPSPPSTASQFSIPVARTPSGISDAAQAVAIPIPDDDPSPAAPLVTSRTRILLPPQQRSAPFGPLTRGLLNGSTSLSNSANHSRDLSSESLEAGTGALRVMMSQSLARTMPVPPPPAPASTSSASSGSQHMVQLMPRRQPRLSGSERSAHSQ